METTFLKTVQGNKMEKMFNYNGHNFSIKHYEAINVNDEGYSPKNVYKFRIKLRHSEDSNAEQLFDEAYNKMFPKKTKSEPKKKTFLVSTEVGRVKGRISFYIAEIVPNKGLRLIDNDYTCSLSSHKGIDSEAVQALVNRKELPITAITASHYRDARVKNYNLIIIEGRGLNYIAQY